MKALNQRLADGEPEAFAEWYDAVSGSVYHYLLTQTASSQDAADLLQNTFVRLFRYRDKLRQVTNLRAYAFCLARNEWARWAQQRQREVPREVWEPWFEPVAKSAADETLDLEVLQQALRRLEPEQREVVELKTYGQLTFQEIADVVQRPVGTVATWYRRAIEQLQRTARTDRRHE